MIIMIILTPGVDSRFLLRLGSQMMCGEAVFILTSTSMLHYLLGKAFWSHQFSLPPKTNEIINSCKYNVSNHNHHYHNHSHYSPCRATTPVSLLLLIDFSSVLFLSKLTLDTHSLKSYPTSTNHHLLALLLFLFLQYFLYISTLVLFLVFCFLFHVPQSPKSRICNRIYYM